MPAAKEEKKRVEEFVKMYRERSRENEEKAKKLLQLLTELYPEANFYEVLVYSLPRSNPLDPEDEIYVFKNIILKISRRPMKSLEEGIE